MAQVKLLKKANDVITQIDSVTDDITANSFTGDGSGLTNLATTTTQKIQSFTSITTVNVTHNFNQKPIVQVYDSTGEVIIPDSIVHNTSNDFTITFLVAQTGTVIAVKGGYSAGTQQVTQTYTSVTSQVVTHNLGNSDPIVQVYDSSIPKQQIIPEKIEITDSNNVTVTFQVATSGTIVVQG